MGLALALALAFGATSASADMATYNITASNGFGGSGPFGTATINVTSSTSVTFSFTAAPGDQIFGIAFNFSPTGGATLNTPSSVSPASGVSWSLQSNGNMDGIGTFSEKYHGMGFAGSVASGSFTLSGTGLTLAMFQGLSSGSNNPSGSPLAIEEGALNTAGNGFANTGFSGSDAVPIPEPSTLAIAGLGALGFVGYGLRRRLKS
jgi:hypothetical protein